MNFITRIQSVPFNQKFAIILLVVMSTQLVVIEGLTVSPLKVTVMVVSCFIFLFRVPYFSKAVWGSVVYWGVCFLTALLNGEVRFSDINHNTASIGFFSSVLYLIEILHQTTTINRAAVKNGRLYLIEIQILDI